ncbi:hypothetical protein MTR67_005050, partial [Solanum verrucosum]
FLCYFSAFQILHIFLSLYQGTREQEEGESSGSILEEKVVGKT